MRIDRLAFCLEAHSRRNVRSSRRLSSARCSTLRSDSPKPSIGCTRSVSRPSSHTESAVIMVDRYRKKIAAMVIQMAKDDPQLVKEMILKLRRSGEIEADDLRYLERIADRWLEITEENLQKARC